MTANLNIYISARSLHRLHAAQIRPTASGRNSGTLVARRRGGAVRWRCGDVVVRLSGGGGVVEVEKNSGVFWVEWNRLNFGGVVPIDELSSDHGSFAQHKSRRNREVQRSTDTDKRRSVEAPTN